MALKKSIILGVTGASGSVYARQLLLKLHENPGVERIDLVFSQAGVRVVSEELGVNVAGVERRAVCEFLGGDSEKVILHSANDIGASIASGSYLSDAMVIAPASMSTVAAIASGAGRDLIHRAADVMLKESRTLILVPRETPLNVIHLENLLKLATLGVRIIPPMPGFYHHPKTIDDLIEHFIYRLLDHLGLPHQQTTRWSGSPKKIKSQI